MNDSDLNCLVHSKHRPERIYGVPMPIKHHTTQSQPTNFRPPLSLFLQSVDSIRLFFVILKAFIKSEIPSFKTYTFLFHSHYLFQPSLSFFDRPTFSFFPFLAHYPQINPHSFHPPGFFTKKYSGFADIPSISLYNISIFS